MLLFFLIALAALRISAHLVVRDIEPAEEQLANIANQIENLLSTVNDFPKSGATAGQLLNIITLFDEVAETTVNATTSVQACVKTTGLASVSDATEFIDLVQNGYQPLLNFLLTLMDAFEPFFLNTTLGEEAVGLLLSTLQNYNTSNANYLAALITGTPTALLPNATAIQGLINSAFAATIEQYEMPVS